MNHGEPWESYPDDCDAAELAQLHREAASTFREKLLWNERMWAFGSGSENPAFKQSTRTKFWAYG